MVCSRFLFAILLLSVGCGCRPPQGTVPPSSREVGLQSAAALPEGLRPAYLDGFQSGAAMVQVSLREGRQPFLLRPGGPLERVRAQGALPEGASLVEVPPAVELDPATGLQLRGLPEGAGSPFLQGQYAGFAWAMALHAEALAKAGLTRPKAVPSLPSSWTRWDDQHNRVQVAGGHGTGDVSWFPGILVWQTAHNGFPPQRRWRPAPGWLQPLYLAMQPDALWVETRGHGAVALDPETGAILATLPAQPHPAGAGFASYEAYAASERLKLQGPAQVAQLAALKRQAGAGDSEAMYQIGRSLVPSDQEPEGMAVRLVWFLEAARRGHVKAMLEVAAIYNGGMGVPLDGPEAQRWAARAAATGNAEAKQVLEGLYSGGPLSQ